MTRFPSRKIGLLCASLMAGALGLSAAAKSVSQATAAEDPSAPVPAAPGAAQPKPEAAPPRAAGPCLEKPLHWTALPALAPGLTIVHSWFIEFEVPDGTRIIPARIFLVERREHPARIICLGHEIEATPGFTPDFKVAKGAVKSLGECMYRVNLGGVEAMPVRTMKSAEKVTAR